MGIEILMERMEERRRKDNGKERKEKRWKGVRNMVYNPNAQFLF